MPDVTPPPQLDTGPISRTTHIPFFKRILGPRQTIEPVGAALTLRYAVPADTDAIDGLAQLDSARAPRGVVLVAEVGGGRNHLLPRVWPGTGYDRAAIG